MKVGITGHQERDGIDWAWVRRAIRSELAHIEASQALSSLAAGSDQIFAEVALDQGIPVLAILPLPGYEGFFEPSARANYRRILAQCGKLQLPLSTPPEKAFFEAGKFIVDHCNVLFAVWDGDVSEGLGGTADVVAYSRCRNCRLIHINPIDESVMKA